MSLSRLQDAGPPPPPPLPPAPARCCLCGERGDPSVPGGLAQLLTARQEHPLPDRAYHEACARWSAMVGYGCRHGQGREAYPAGCVPADLLAREQRRSRHVKCAVCGRLGAALQCKEYRQGCAAAWHLPCARHAAQESGKVVFAADAREAACAEHASSIEQPLQEPAGLWFEAHGGWGGQQPAAAVQQQDAYTAAAQAAMEEAVRDAEQALQRAQQQQQPSPPPPPPQQQQQVPGAPASGAAGSPGAEARRRLATLRQLQQQAAAVEGAALREANQDSRNLLARPQRPGAGQPAAPRLADLADAAAVQPGPAKRAKRRSPDAAAPPPVTSKQQAAGSGRQQQATDSGRHSEPEMIDLTGETSDEDADGGAAAAHPIELRRVLQRKQTVVPPRRMQQRGDVGEHGMRPAHPPARQPPPPAPMTQPPGQQHVQPSQESALPAAQPGPPPAEGQQHAQPPAQQQQGDDAAARPWLVAGHRWALGGSLGCEPPCGPGSHLALGTAISEGAKFQWVVREYARRMQEDPEAYPAVVVACTEHHATRRALQARIEAFISAAGGGGALTFAADLPRLLPVAPGLEAVPVDADDPRRGLAADPGARRVRATRALERNAVLGAYQAVQLPNHHYQRMKADAELATALQLPLHQLGLTLESYAADLDTCEAFAVGQGSVRRLLPAAAPLHAAFGAPPSLVFTLSAYGCPNEMALINDAALDPLAAVARGQTRFAQLPGGANCRFVPALVLGWPFLFVVTSREVQPGEELLLEYGHQYWELLRGAIETSAAIQAEVQRLQAQAQQAQQAQAQLQSQVAELQQRLQAALAAAAAAPKQP